MSFYNDIVKNFFGDPDSMDPNFFERRINVIKKFIGDLRTKKSNRKSKNGETVNP